MTPMICPSLTRSPSLTDRVSRSPDALAVIWAEDAYVKAAPEAQAAPPTLAEPWLVSDSTPGLLTRMVTCRTRVPPGPTSSVAAISSTVPVTVSAVPLTVTVAAWPM